MNNDEMNKMVVKSVSHATKTDLDVTDRQAMLQYCFQLGVTGASFGIVHTATNAILRTLFITSIVNKPTAEQEQWLDAWKPDASEMLAFELGHVHGTLVVGTTGKERCEQRVKMLLTSDLEQIDQVISTMVQRLGTAALLGITVPEDVLNRLKLLGGGQP